MDDGRQAHFKQLLEARREALLAAGDVKIEPNRKDASSVGVADEDEQALSEMLQTLASARNRDTTKELGQIQLALKKLRESADEYGECEECGDEISDKRLQLMPWAALCAECQSSLDPKRNQPRKKLTDYR